MRLSLLVIALLTGIFATAQKKVIDASVYNDWKRVGDVILSADGKFSAYTIKPHRGDGFLYVVDNESGRTDSFPRAIEPQFAANSSFIVFKITPGFDTLRKSELNKVNKDKWPKDSLGIWYTTAYKLEKIAKVKDYKLAVDGDILAYISQGNELPAGYQTKKEKRKEKREIKKNGPVKSDGKLLTVWKPSEERSKALHYRNVTTYEFSQNGAFLAFVQQQKYKKDSLRLHVLTANQRTIWKSPVRYTAYNQLSFGETASKLTGLFSTDTSDQKRWNAFYFDAASWNWTTFIDTAMRFERDRVVAGSFKPRFSQDESKLFFGVWDIQKIPAKDTLLETEKAKLDLWHWQDERIQPQQLAELKADEVNSNLHVYLMNEQRFVQLERDSLDIRLPRKGPLNFMLASSDFYKSQNWRSPMPFNYYRISATDGQPELLKEALIFDANLSPSGRYFIYYNELKKQLFSRDLTAGTETCLTCKVKTNWFNDLNGMPETPGPQGIIGWTENENGVLIQAENDIWHYDLTSDRINSISENFRKSATDTNYKYSLGLWSADSLYLHPSNCYLVQMNKATKSETIFQLSDSFSKTGMQELASSNHHYIGWKKAKYADAKIFQRHSAVEYPDVYVLGNGKAEPKKISEANPQQKEYNWTTVELISWKSYEGIPLEGLVYKPENFDPNKEYPLLVYFYEMYTDELHNHYAPKPTASIIFPTEYASAGYVVLIPDIRYKPGHPGNSAYDCIMSGTDAVLKKYPNIDAKRLGLQGQSWGGYQTAQLVTMTDRYKAAMAGAPVSNMFSAYGGIRWGSGYSRQFQYEHTQSRIGKTIWEAPQLYIENSPLFHLPKVKTPLLIMANDQDGAVPWYQGIELYMGLRRLQKPVWMLNYNGDDHNLMKNANRIDLSIRMRQFFDYYLLDKPMPLWLKEGIPAIEKGKDYKLQLSE